MMQKTGNSLIAALLVGFVTLGFGVEQALAQQAASTQGQNQAASSDVVQASWTKICGAGQGENAKDTCLTVNESRTNQGQFIASVAIEENQKNKNLRVMRLALPVGLLIQPGVLVNVDEKKGYPARFEVCLPNLCYATTRVTDTMIGELKAGNELFITGRNMQGREIKLNLSLSGFTKSYEGDPVDTKQIQKQHEELQESLRKKAEEERKKLLDGGSKQ